MKLTDLELGKPATLNNNTPTLRGAMLKAGSQVVLLEASQHDDAGYRTVTHTHQNESQDVQIRIETEVTPK